MVTDSVAPRPSAKMLGHIQHPSVPAVCVCVQCACVCMCVCVRNADVCVCVFGGDPAKAGVRYAHLESRHQWHSKWHIKNLMH